MSPSPFNTMSNQEHQELLSSGEAPHRLQSLDEGASQVEQLAAKIEGRREQRILITFPVRVALETECREIAVRKGYASKNKVRREDMVAIRQRVASEIVKERGNLFLYWGHKILGMKTTNQYTLETLDRAILHIDAIQDEWFHCVEFSFFYTKVVSKWPWMRNQSANAFLVVILFFFCTPILFCYVLEDESICEGSSSEMGWLQGIYFGSVTISTVGYGDVKVSPENTNIGTAYMLISICVSILAFSAAAEDAFAPFEKLYERLLKIDPDKVAEGEIIYKRIQRIRLIKLSEIVIHFVALNLVGVVVSRFFQGDLSNVEEHARWTMAQSVYWSVQSTTTIGYGDLEMGQKMRLFQVFYLCFGTFFVGNTLGKLSNLKSDMEGLRRLYAWEQREVGKEMLRSDQADCSDNKVDQYEFVIASLLNLGKVTSEDIKPIMNKFRKLAKSSGDEGYIDLGKNANEDPDRLTDYAKDYLTM